MLALRATRSLRRLSLISQHIPATALIKLQLTPGRRCFGTSLPLAKNRKGPKRLLANGRNDITDQKTAEFVMKHVADRHTAIIKASLGIVNLDRAPYDTVISIQDVKDALVETGRLIMSTGVDPVEYSPGRLMSNPMVFEQVYKVNDIFDSAGMDPRYMLRAIQASQLDPGAVRIHRRTGSGRYFQNSATGESEELDVLRLMAVQNGIKVYRVLQARPELAAIVLAAGKHSLSHNVDSIKLSDWKSLKAAGLTSLDFLEANEAVGSALNVVLWGPPNSEKERSWRPFHNFTWKKRWLFEALRRFFRLDEWFANYNKALMVLSLEAVNEVKTGTSFYHETLQDPYIIDHLRKVGKYLISIGMKDDGTIPSITVSRENDALSAKLHALHQHMQLKDKCPVGLLANMRKMQREVGFPCIGNDDWEKIDAIHLSLFKKIT